MNKRQKAFVKEYLKDLNATQAAIRAGYAAKAAAAVASRLLRNVNVAESVKEALDKRSERCDLTADMVLAELRRVAFTHMGKLARWNASGVEFKDSDQLGEDDLATVSEITETTNQHGGSLKVKQYDKVRALELIGRHLGMWNDKLELVDDDRPLEEMSDTDLVKLRGNGK